MSLKELTKTKASTTKKTTQKRPNKLVSSLKRGANDTQTQNGAKTLKTTDSPLLDLFSRAAAMRGKPESEITHLLDMAYGEDPQLTWKMVFYFRNIRGTGQGERQLFRTCLKWLSNIDAKILRKNIKNIPEFGRWDDVVFLVDTPVKNAALKLIEKQLSDDIDQYDNGNHNNMSLLAKWLPSENASSKETKRLAGIVRGHLGYTERNYRKILSALREALNVVERQMTMKDWNNINYSGVPSRASTNYRKAFLRNDETRYRQFLSDVSSGKTKINSGTLYPHDLVYKIISSKSVDNTLEEQWKALPDYCEGSTRSVLPVVDVSGSMQFHNLPGSRCRPYHVSIAMGLYFAERIEGPFKNHLISFASDPKFTTLNNGTIRSKIQQIMTGCIGYSTNFQKVFDLILETAILNGITQDQMPESVIVFSDMEFNKACDHKKTNFKSLKQKYKNSGYKMPQMTFWNIDAKTQQSPVSMNEQGVSLVSGFSPSVFKYVTSGIFKTPYEIMVETLSDPVFDKIVMT